METHVYDPKAIDVKDRRYISINPYDLFYYEIPFSRKSTVKDAAKWINHLCEKIWFDSVTANNLLEKMLERIQVSREVFEKTPVGLLVLELLETDKIYKENEYNPMKHQKDFIEELYK